VGDEDEGLLLGLAQPQHVLLEHPARLFVDCGKGLVEQEDLGVDGERAGEADALAHAAGELMRIALLEAGEADRGDVAPGDLVALRLAHAAELEAEGDVADHGRPGHQREVLEDEGALGAGAGDRAAGDADLAGGRCQEARNDLQERGLAAAAGTEERGQSAPGETEIDRLQRLDTAGIDLADAPHLDQVGDRRAAIHSFDLAQRAHPIPASSPAGTAVPRPAATTPGPPSRTG
jgi:hypothetical protein